MNQANPTDVLGKLCTGRSGNMRLAKDVGAVEALEEILKHDQIPKKKAEITDIVKLLKAIED